ncbi:ATP-binding protein [Streptomyces erythrochromogenes]|uniref:ATP-binding protein n=1 Tax=Streptomyces erythrochromogenes TaxID=285574 RepID=UPI00380533DD
MSGLRAARHAPSRHAVTGPGRQIRPQLVRAALLPTLAAALSGAAAVIFTLQLGGGAGDRDARLWPVLMGCALLTVGALAAALLGAQRAAKAVRDRCEALRRSSVRGRQELRTAADRLERGEAPPRPVRGGPNAPLTGGDPAGVDEFWLLSQELRGAREQAHTTLVRLAAPAAPTDSERKVEVFVNLARRLQSLVHREISLLDDLEDTVEDPDLLKELFHVDHLATRIRRHAENLAVLGGAASRRQWTRPIDLSEVLRSSVAEVEQYTRVKVVPPAGGSVRGHAVADVVHLLAELVENATVFSAPDTDVVLRAERVTAGIAVEVEDRGLGMPAEEQHRMNALLGDPDQVSVRSLLADGRIGLYVVSALARRHGIAVELKSNIYGGVLAVLVLPQELLGAAEAADAAGGSRVTPPLEPARMPLPRRAGPTVPTPRSEPAPTPAESWGATTTGTGGLPPAPSGLATGTGRPAARGDTWAETVAGPRPGDSSDPAPWAVPGSAPDAWPPPEPAIGRSGEPRTWAEPVAEVQAAPGAGRSDGREAAHGADTWPASGGGPSGEPGSGPVARPGSVVEQPAAPAIWAEPEGGTPSGRPTVREPGAASAEHGSGPGPGAVSDVWDSSDTPSGGLVDPWAVTDGGPSGRPGSGIGRSGEPETRAEPEADRWDGREPGTGPGPGSTADVSGAPSDFWGTAGAGLSGAPGATAAGPAAGRSSGPGPGSAVDAWSVPSGEPGTGAEARPGSEPRPGAAADAWSVPGIGTSGEPGAGADAWSAPGGGPSGESWAAARSGGGVDAQQGESGGHAVGERPVLPRRRAQQHLAPQLRGAPAPRRPADTEQPVHDPGLMAAFQRGFGLAQSENQV